MFATLCDLPKQDVPPLIAASKSYLVSVLRDELFLLGTLGGEVGVMLVLEFLHRVADVLNEYFGGLDDACIKDNFSTVYQVPHTP